MSDELYYQDAVSASPTAGVLHASALESVESTSLRIVEAVADAKSTTIDELEPLYNVLNPDALDSLFGNRPNGIPRSGGTLSFEYEGYTITVDGEGFITVQ